MKYPNHLAALLLSTSQDLLGGKPGSSPADVAKRHADAVWGLYQRAERNLAVAPTHETPGKLLEAVVANAELLMEQARVLGLDSSERAAIHTLSASAHFAMGNFDEALVDVAKALAMPSLGYTHRKLVAKLLVEMHAVIDQAEPLVRQRPYRRLMELNDHDAEVLGRVAMKSPGFGWLPGFSNGAFTVRVPVEGELPTECRFVGELPGVGVVWSLLRHARGDQPPAAVLMADSQLREERMRMGSPIGDPWPDLRDPVTAELATRLISGKVFPMGWVFMGDAAPVLELVHKTARGEPEASREPT